MQNYTLIGKYFYLNNKARLERLESRLNNLELYMNISFAGEETVQPADNTRMGSSIVGGNLVSYEYVRNYSSDFNDVGVDNLYADGKFYNCLFSGGHISFTASELSYLIYTLNPEVYCPGNVDTYSDWCSTWNSFDKSGNVYSNRNMQLFLYEVAQHMKCDYVLNDYHKFETLTEPTKVKPSVA